MNRLLHPPPAPAYIRHVKCRSEHPGCGAVSLEQWATVDLMLRFHVSCSNCRREQLRRLSLLSVERFWPGESALLQAWLVDTLSIPAPPPFGAGPWTQEKQR